MSNNGWISVEDELPNKPGLYLVATSEHGVGLITWSMGDVTPRWLDSDREQFSGVTHWMPLPEPPKEVT